MADPFAPVVPALGDLLNEAQPCYCQQGRDQFVAIPRAGTYLVQDGRAATVPEPTPVVPLGDFIGQVISGMYDYAARTLADAPPGVQLQVRLSADGTADARVLGTYVFEREPQEATHG